MGVAAVSPPLDLAACSHRALPELAMLLLIRALLPAPWDWYGRWTLRKRATRLVAAGGMCCATAILGTLAVWAAYGFRFDPTPVPGAMLNTSSEIH